MDNTQKPITNDIKDEVLGPTFCNEDTPSVYEQIKDLEGQHKACEQELAQLLDEFKRVPDDLELVKIIVKWRIDETQEQRFKIQLELNELFRIYGKYYFHNNNI